MVKKIIVNAIIEVMVSEITSVCPKVPRLSWSKYAEKISPKTVEKAIVIFFVVSTNFIGYRFFKMAANGQGLMMWWALKSVCP